MVNVSISRRYARALVDVASESSKLDAIADQLSTVTRAMDQQPDFADVLLNPAFTRAQRMALVDGLVKSAGGMEPAVANLLRLLVERSRLQFLPDIARLYRDMVDSRMGRLRGRVTTPKPIAGDTVQRIEQALEKVTQRDVVLEAKVDPSLLGGVSAQVGSTVYDFSLKAQLEELRRSLLER